MKCRRCHGTGQEADHSIVGRQMRSLREHRGVSLRKVATAMGVSPAYLSDLEVGRRGWNNYRATRFKKALAQVAKRIA